MGAPRADAITAIDMCVVPTVTFERLFAFLVLDHGRQQLLWFEVTRHPTAEWLARQITEAFPGYRRQRTWSAITTAVCTENLNPNVMVMKSAKDGV